MVKADDWRRMRQEDYLKNRRLAYVAVYSPSSATWEHEHCAFCFEKISLHPGTLHSGYHTIDGEHVYWICEPCFADFKEEFAWITQKEDK